MLQTHKLVSFNTQVELIPSFPLLRFESIQFDSILGNMKRQCNDKQLDVYI